MAFESVPWVRRAAVRREWPNKLVVVIDEHKPLGTWGEDGKLITQVLPLDVADEDAAVVPRSWMFADCCGAGAGEPLHVLTWSLRDHLPQEPLSAHDDVLIAELARTFRDWGMTGRFGMALSGPAPGTGMIWTEGNHVDSRHLVQAPRPLEDVQDRGPVTTLYAFSADGADIVPLCCCVSGRAASEHIWSRRPWERRC